MLIDSEDLIEHSFLYYHIIIIFPHWNSLKISTGVISYIRKDYLLNIFDKVRINEQSND